MLPEVRKALDDIEDILMRNDHIAQDLCAILSALRGPDDPLDGLLIKSSTTVPIRRQAFPRLARLMAPKNWCNSECYFSCPWTFTGTERVDPAFTHALGDHAQTHFGSHIAEAARALDRHE